MKALFLTNEYPPHVYGGAGVHVDYLSRELAKLMQVEVRCFGDQDSEQGNLKVRGYEVTGEDYTSPKPLRSVFGAVNAASISTPPTSIPTWCTATPGTAISAESWPRRTTGFRSSSPFIRSSRSGHGSASNSAAVTISVFGSKKPPWKWRTRSLPSPHETKKDIERLFNVSPDKVPVIYNGIDLDEYRKVRRLKTLERFRIDPNRPFVLFVGRITRQKGIVHLVRAIQYFDKDSRSCCAAGAPDTPEIADEMKAAVEPAQAGRSDVIWIQEMLDKPSVIELYSQAAVFCCPSIYEPFGIINLEAMACETRRRRDCGRRNQGSGGGR